MPEKEGSGSVPSDADKALDQGQTPTDGICVVGIGASAGGLEALKRLLAHLPPDTGFAFVLIQHLDPTHRSSLSEILGRATAMPVGNVGDGTLVEPNHVYVIPPNTALTIDKQVLRLNPREQEGPHLPIDQFLRSLARDCGSRAIGVILSGAGSDGSLGLQAIKEVGGVTFAQEPATAEFPSMPTMADAIACVDFVLPPERIAVELGRIAHHPHFAVAERAEQESPPTERAAQFHAIVTVMHKATGIDFSLYREKTVQRRILRRLALRNITSLEEYAEQLKADAGERSALQRDLLICVTNFFRDPESFEALKKLVFPAILQDRPAGLAIRIWVPGCATGEEAYSIAISLQEYLKESGNAFPVQIFASDISEAAIEKARNGRYPDNIEADVSPERLTRYFTKVEGGYQISKPLREMCVFSRHNLIDDPPFSKLDLISCRNVLIYLVAVQKNIIAMFHYALKEHGFLMLGRSETAHFGDMFSIVDRNLRIYAKRNAGKRPYGFYARAATVGGYATGPESAAQAPVAELWDGADMGKAVDQILVSKHSSAGVLVDEGLEVLEIRGQAAPFLRLPRGKMSFHLLKLLPDMGVFLVVEKLVQEASETGKAVRQERVAYESAGHVQEVNIEVRPLPGKGSAQLILFEPVSEPAGESFERPLERAAEMDDRDRLIKKLQQEVEEARRRLVSGVEEHQISEQESQNATEEALSANEELQSLNEELETAKEELQSTNEELITLNSEVETRNTALTEARDFAAAIVETVQAPLLVLDSALRIKSVNASFTRAFQVSPRDSEGQLIYSLGGDSWDIPGLRDRLERVLPSRHSFEGFEVEREFPSVGRRVLILNACRLESLDMILLAVDDVTARREAEKALRTSEEQLRQAQKMEAVGRLAGGIAHDFNNLLTTIIGYSHLIADSLDLDHAAWEYVREVESAVKNAVTLTDQLLAFSRRKILQPKVFDLNLLIADFGRMLRRLVGETIKIELHPAAGLWRVRADPGEIGRGVMNLCLNARDAMPSGGTLTISTANLSLDEADARQRNLEAGQYVRLEVRDTGIGMDPEMQIHIFEPFFTTKEADKGTGLGLATVLGIIEQSGGAIWCNSELGRGTRFRIVLPAVLEAPDQVERPVGRLSAAPKGSSEVILLVEDEDRVRKLARTILQERGYVVLEAKDGREGLSVCENHKGTIDLLVSDVVMPELGGRELAQRARMMRPDLKVLFMSGHTQDVILKEGIKKGAAFLQKPFSPIELAHKVRELLDAKPHSELTGQH